MQTGQARSKYPNFKEAVMQRLILLVVGSIVLAGQLLAQTAQDSWDNLKRLRAGQKIEVVNTDMKSVKGSFVSYAEDGISLQTDKGPLTIERARVMRISLREHSKRARNALIGAAVGAGAGLALGAAGDRGIHETGEGNFAKAIFTPIGAGAGAGIGAAMPSYETIYRAPKR
jgi:hypothetical protein